MNQQFISEFRNVKYIVDKATSILLVAHSHPDPDTAGANVAMKEYLTALEKKVDIVCFDNFPENLKPLFDVHFLAPEEVDWKLYDAIIALDSVDRGFDRMQQFIQEGHAVILFDHHPHIQSVGDVTVIDASYSSTCEIIYDYFEYAHIAITPRIATALLTGLSFDTGSFQHSSTTPRVLEIASILMRRGAPLTKISDTVFLNKKVSSLRLWGRAFLKAKLIPGNGMIVTALTQQDILECGASTHDLNQAASILSTVPGARFALLFFQLDDKRIKGSLRSKADGGADVSEIAKTLGGAGHKLASGFEMLGTIMEDESGWIVV